MLSKLSRQIGGLRLLSSSASAPPIIGSLPESVSIYEVGPRDGLQNEKGFVSTEHKLDLIDKLVAAGLKMIESTSYVSPKWMPQLADHCHVVKRIARQPGVRYPVLVPNMQGLEMAIREKAEDIAIFTAVSEDFVKKNINCTVEESMARFEEVTKTALENNLQVRGYISTVVACPYAGKQDPEKVAKMTEKMLEWGCYEVSLGDTIGVGTPKDIADMLNPVIKAVGSYKLALHCHDTYGMAVANCLTAIQMGIRTLDSSIAGLGGCPYAKGASGNVATEDLVYMLHGLGVETGVDLDKATEAGCWISRTIGKHPASRVTRARRGPCDIPICDSIQDLDGMESHEL